MASCGGGSAWLRVAPRSAYAPAAAAGCCFGWCGRVLDGALFLGWFNIVCHRLLQRTRPLLHFAKGNGGRGAGGGKARPLGKKKVSPPRVPQSQLGEMRDFVQFRHLRYDECGGGWGSGPPPLTRWPSVAAPRLIFPLLCLCVADHVRDFSCGKMYYRVMHLDDSKDSLYVGAM